MRKTIPIIVLSLGIIVSSCAVFPPQLHLSGVVLIGQPERKASLVTISAQPSWDNPGKGYKKITGFYVEFRNPTSTPVFIVWEKSSLRYDSAVFIPFVQGQKYEDYSRPMNSMVVPPYGVVRKYIYSSQQVYREAGKSGNWKLRPIEADHVVLEFYIQSRDFADRYTIEVR
jgi:hypothetical protein